MKHFEFGILIFFISLNTISNAQQEFRQFGVNDSTEYVLNNDTTVIVSRNKLYYNTTGGLISFYDFSTTDSLMYIRDFDIISDSIWYVIHGNKFDGGPAILYKSTDHGISWVSDTSIFIASQVAENNNLIANFDALFQMQKISKDTILLFVSYYQSGIFYSTDAGISWNIWFANTIANYRGLLECGDEYFLWGLEGDGFLGSMFSFRSDLLISPDTNDVWSHLPGTGVYHPDCFSGSNADCVYAANSLTAYDQFLFFENYVNQNCQNLAAENLLDNTSDNLKVFPNPANNGKFIIQWNTDFSTPNYFKVLNLTGQLILSNEMKMKNEIIIDISAFDKGLYILVIEYSDRVVSKKLFY